MSNCFWINRVARGGPFGERERMNEGSWRMNAGFPRLTARFEGSKGDVHCRLHKDDVRFCHAGHRWWLLMKTFFWRMQRWWQLRETGDFQVLSCRIQVKAHDVESTCCWCRKIKMTASYYCQLFLYWMTCECKWKGKRNINNFIGLHYLCHYLLFVLFALLYFNSLYLWKYSLARNTKYVPAIIVSFLVVLHNLIFFSTVRTSRQAPKMFGREGKHHALIDGYLWRWIKIFRFILFCPFALVLPFVL